MIVQSVLPRCIRNPSWRVLFALFATFGLHAVAPFPGLQAQPTQQPKLVLISWDGAADWVVDRLLAEGKLPNVAALAARGAAADYSLSTFPSKTAVAHATLWTGAWPGTTGITSNTVPQLPAAEHTLLEHQRGFSSLALQAEPLYVTAARAGRKVVLLSATHSYPPDPYLQALGRDRVAEDRLLTFSGFEHLIAPGHLFGAEALHPPSAEWKTLPPHLGTPLELEFQLGESSFHGLVYDAPEDPTVGFDRLLLRQGNRGSDAIAQAVLTPRPASDPPCGWSPAFRVHQGDLQGGTFFRLFELSSDGSHLALYQWETSGLRGAHQPQDLEDYLAAYPAFHDDAFGRYYQGQLGTPIPDGGDGTAEERLLEIVAHDTRQLTLSTRFGLAHWQPDLLWHYSPMSDSAGHTWMGILDPNSPTHDAALAARLWPFYVRVFQHLDAWLGEVLQLVDDNTLVALVTDHGMEGSGRLINTNTILEEAGLLTRDFEGEIDLARTLVLGEEASFFVRLNTTSRKGGVVTPAQYQRVLQRARSALLEATDPGTRNWLFSRVLEQRELTSWGLDHPNAGDLYLDPMPGFYPTPQGGTARTQPYSKAAWGAGTHGFWPTRRSMQAIFYLAGPGVSRGLQIPPMRHVDIAPTLAYLLGLPAPAQSQGRVIEAFLRPPLTP